MFEILAASMLLIAVEPGEIPGAYDTVENPCDLALEGVPTASFDCEDPGLESELVGYTVDTPTYTYRLKTGMPNVEQNLAWFDTEEVPGSTAPYVEGVHVPVCVEESTGEIEVAGVGDFFHHGSGYIALGWPQYVEITEQCVAGWSRELLAVLSVYDIEPNHDLPFGGGGWTPANFVGAQGVPWMLMASYDEDTGEASMTARHGVVALNGQMTASEWSAAKNESAWDSGGSSLNMSIYCSGSKSQNLSGGTPFAEYVSGSGSSTVFHYSMSATLESTCVGEPQPNWRMVLVDGATVIATWPFPGSTGYVEPPTFDTYATLTKWQGLEDMEWTPKEREPGELKVYELPSCSFNADHPFLEPCADRCVWDTGGWNPIDYLVAVYGLMRCWTEPQTSPGDFIEALTDDIVESPTLVAVGTAVEQLRVSAQVTAQRLQSRECGTIDTPPLLGEPLELDTCPVYEAGESQWGLVHGLVSAMIALGFTLSAVGLVFWAAGIQMFPTGKDDDE